MAFYWYQSDPDLYRAEVQAMNKFFPSFTIHQLPDGSGRLYWRGKVQPAGPDGMVWDLMLIYKNDHPHAGASEYGGSIQILPVQPRLKDIATRMMPILEETYGSYENCVDMASVLVCRISIGIISDVMKNILFVLQIRNTSRRV